jgi:hypothetical protein
MTNSPKRNTGFIALHRTIQEHWIWDDPIKLKWWLDILMAANHSDQKAAIGFQLVECKRGQTVRSIMTWAKRWRVDESTVRRFFDLLKKDGMIKTESVVKTTRLTVCNYDNYNNPKRNTQGIGKDETIPEQFEDNTNNNVSNNGNHVNNDSETALSSPFLNLNKGASIKGELSQEQKEEYKYFNIEVENRCPEALKAKNPITIDQQIRLNKMFPGKPGTTLIKAALSAIHDSGLLPAAKCSVFTFLKNWIQRESQDEEIIFLRTKCNELTRIVPQNGKYDGVARIRKLHTDGEKMLEAL